MQREHSQSIFVTLIFREKRHSLVQALAAFLRITDARDAWHPGTRLAQEENPLLFAIHVLRLKRQPTITFEAFCSRSISRAMCVFFFNACTRVRWLSRVVMWSIQESVVEYEVLKGLLSSLHGQQSGSTGTGASSPSVNSPHLQPDKLDQPQISPDVCLLQGLSHLLGRRSVEPQNELNCHLHHHGLALPQD